MRIGVNCLHIHPAYTGGVNSFTFGLLDGFVRAGAPHEVKIFVRPWNEHAFESYRTVPHFEIVEVGESQHRWFHAVHRRLPWQLRRRVGLPVLTRPYEDISE